MELINLTPHAVNFYDVADLDKAGTSWTPRELAVPHTIIEPSGIVARAAVAEEKVGDVEGLPVFVNTYGAPVNLPAPESGKAYIVSALTAQAAAQSGRTTADLYVVTRTVRNAAGQIIGAAGLAQIV